MDLKMNFNKILIQDVVHKRDYNKETYRSTTDISDDEYDDDSLISDSQCGAKNENCSDSKCDNKKCSDNNNNNIGDKSRFIYADSNLFDKLDYNYGENIGGSDHGDKLSLALDLLRVTVEQNTQIYEDKCASLHHHHRNRRNNTGYSDESQKRKSFDHYTHDERMLKKNDKIVVEIRVVFIKIGEIDTLKEIYHADAFIQAKWREPKLDDQHVEDLKSADLERLWNPLLFIDNILTESKDQYWLSATQNTKKETYIIERRKLKGVFLETLELNDFPLDVQDLTITISSERPDSEIDLVPDNVELSGINLQSFVDQQEWQLHEHVEVEKRVVTQEYTSSCRRHPCISVTCRASRRPGYFYWNVFLVMFFITGLSFATFSVPPTRPENRLQLSFTLFLTSVAFKFVINQSLPRISYLTYMDKYVLMSLAILCIISVWHSVITLIKPAHLEADLAKSINVQQSHSSNHSSSTTTSSTTTNRKSRSFYSSTNAFQSSYSSYSPSSSTLSTSSLPIKNNEKNQSTSSTKQQKRNIPKRKASQTILANSQNSDAAKRLIAAKKLRRKEKAMILKFQMNIERDILISFVLLYIFAHLFFIFWLYFGASRRRREMIEKDRQYRKIKRKAELKLLTNVAMNG